jgi:tRNA dimethylallyltransferase
MSETEETTVVAEPAAAGTPAPAPLAAETGPRRAPVLTIMGPTAVGKTAVALLVAARAGAEIVSADSRQIYRGMDVGTAKPTPEERSRVRHHLIDIVEPSERYDAARFAADAERVISGLLAASVAPLVVGGTGFYLESLYEGLFEGPERDDAVRGELELRLAAEGPEALHEALGRVDPGAAARIHPRDASRIVRALEVFRATGTPMSKWLEGPRRTPSYRPLYVGITMPRRALHERIGLRVEHMFRSGLTKEVKALRAGGRLLPGMPAASAVGYRELLELDDAALGSPEGEAVARAAERIATSTRRYAKRQLTWFRSLPGVRWLDVQELGVEGVAEETLRLARRRNALTDGPP